MKKDQLIKQAKQIQILESYNKFPENLKIEDNRDLFSELEIDDDIIFSNKQNVFTATVKNIDKDNNDVDILIKNVDNISEAKYKNREVELNEPAYDSGSESHKFRVYVTHPKTGKVKKVGFGSPDMEIKRDNKDRRKSFRARHKCDKWNFKDHRHTARYWSCRMWQDDESVTDIVSN